jgi:sugar phosphate isomerase/epimerase
MSPKLGLQLYTVRDRINADGYEAIVRQVAKIGFAGVETAGFPGTSAAEAAKLFKELGLTVIGAHAGLPLGEHKNEILDTMAILGSPYVVLPYVSPDEVKDLDSIKKLVERLNEAQPVAAKAGLKILVHNHWAEFHLVDGRPAMEIVAEWVDPAVLFELDTYWIKVGGVDPVGAVTRFGKRAPLLHIKDGTGVREDPQTAAGKGIMDFPAILKAGGSNTEWLIYEADRVAGDAIEACAESFVYLKAIL